jgi:hypothetical protein
MNRQEPMTLLGVAKNLLVRLVERGLNVPDARSRRLEMPLHREPRAEVRPASALPTVTLAEIYLSQGHRERALETLRFLLVREPGDAQARSLYERLSSGEMHVPEPKLKPESTEDVHAPAPAAVHVVVSDRGGAHFCEAVRSLDGCIAVRWAAGAVGPDAQFALQVVTIRARWTGPETTRDLLRVGPRGTREVIADAQTVVRFALGCVTADGAFTPLAHAPELEKDESGALFAWTQRGREPLAS